MSDEKVEDVSISKRMVTYTGTKTIKAFPMLKHEYLDYRGWDLPDGEDPKEEIYLVEYEPDPKSEPNHPDHAGYISMSPKHVFDKAYKKSGNFLDRLYIERDELGVKINKLAQAIEDKSFADTALDINRKQLKIMDEYHSVLSTKIEMITIG